MPITLEDARQLAKGLRSASPRVQGVELFGSVLRNGIGHDADFMVLVDEDIARRWWADMRDIRVSWPPALLFVRRIIKKYFRALDEASIQAKKHRRQARVSALLGFDVAAFGEAYRPGGGES